MSWELALLHSLVTLRRPWLDDVMILASALGAGGFIWIVFGAITAVGTGRAAAMWRLWLAVALAFVVVDEAVKPLVDRARPFEVAEIALIDARPQTRSFPSGHAAMAAAGALAGTQLLPAAGWALWPLAGLVAVSRIYLGVHWPTDVVAGLLFGLATAWFVLGGRRKMSRN